MNYNEEQIIIAIKIKEFESQLSIKSREERKSINLQTFSKIIKNWYSNYDFYHLNCYEMAFIWNSPQYSLTLMVIFDNVEWSCIKWIESNLL